MHHIRIDYSTNVIAVILAFYKLVKYLFSLNKSRWDIQDSLVFCSAHCFQLTLFPVSQSIEKGGVTIIAPYCSTILSL